MAINQKTTKFQDFEPEELDLTPFQENERSKGQNIAYPRYQNEGAPLMLQGPWIKMNTYGVPRAGEYYKTDNDRAFIKIPLDITNEETNEFYEKLKQIDNKFNSKEFKTKMFGAKASKYKYVPIVREPVEDEEMDDENKKKYPRPPYMKVKLDTTYPEAKVKTQVFTSIMKDGKREREKQTVTTVDEFASVARFLSTIRPIIRPVKGWCEKKVRQGNDYMQYGITFKLIKIEVEPAEGTTNNLSQYMNNDAFIDSDDDETPVQPKKQTSVVSTPVSFSKQKDENEEEEKSESESDEEEEPEPEPEPPKKSKQKPVVRRTKNV